MFLIIILILSAITAPVVFWSVEQYFFNKMFGPYLEKDTPEYYSIQEMLRKEEFRLISDGFISIEGESSTTIKRVDNGIFDGPFYHVSLEDGNDYRLKSGTDLYNSVSELIENLEENYVDKRVERMRKYSNL